MSTFHTSHRHPNSAHVLQLSSKGVEQCRNVCHRSDLGTAARSPLPSSNGIIHGAPEVVQLLTKIVNEAYKTVAPATVRDLEADEQHLRNDRCQVGAGAKHGGVCA